MQFGLGMVGFWDIWDKILSLNSLFLRVAQFSVIGQMRHPILSLINTKNISESIKSSPFIL